MQPGTWQLRRLYVVARQRTDAEANKAVDNLMRKLDLDEIVMEVPAWAQFLVKKRPGTEERTVRKIEEATVTGIHFSVDAIKGRVLVAIAGSRRTVKEGTEEVMRRIEAHEWYKEGDICLRRIVGQSVGTAGFKKIGDAKPLDLSSCKEPFHWKR
ncbi:hypothetical protein AAVH_21301 [Aphelenchoides avenae]|nr:hypothetical protein AAVH_21301 [Aphelenchus avenae]